MIYQLKSFIKKETVFVISFCAAVISSFFVHPSIKYFNYINWNVLFILLSLMTVVAGLQSCGVLYKCAGVLVKKMKTLRSISISLILCCFFFSMFITNDVSLLTFVPFTLLIFHELNEKKFDAYVIVLETAAANLGSMFTPVGNPQNLFLFSQMKIPVLAFCKILLPYTFLSLVMLMLLSLRIPNTVITSSNSADSAKTAHNSKKLFIYISLFIVCLLCVVKIIPAWVSAAVTMLAVLSFDHKNLLKVDYVLLLTFCCFFIFTGNIGNIQKIKEILEKIVQNNEFLTGLITSQIISNVPAALLLEPFVLSKKDLLLGVNAGGLGTLVASLASLISFKLYSNSETKNRSSGTYLLIFTVVNIVCLIPLCLFYFLSCF